MMHYSILHNTLHPSAKSNRKWVPAMKVLRLSLTSNMISQQPQWQMQLVPPLHWPVPPGPIDRRLHQPRSKNVLAFRPFSFKEKIELTTKIIRFRRCHIMTGATSRNIICMQSKGKRIGARAKKSTVSVLIVGNAILSFCHGAMKLKKAASFVEKTRHTPSCRTSMEGSGIPSGIPCLSSLVYLSIGSDKLEILKVLRRVDAGS